MDSFTFTKSERLCSQKIIGEIFLTGKTFISYPFKMVWLDSSVIDSLYPAQVAFSIPKKNIKKAINRNLIRRKMRESYRYLKNDFYDYLQQRGQKIALMIVFIGKEDFPSSELNSAMVKALNRLRNEIKVEKNTSET